MIEAFIDESGNSGRNLYDPQQPTLVYAAVWLDGTAAAELGHILGQLRVRHGVQTQGEPKGSTLVRRASGRSLVKDFFAWLEARNVAITVVIVEKKSMAAGVVVEDCTDSDNNDRFPEQWQWDIRLQNPLTQKIIAHADPAQLARLWELRHGDDRDAWIAAYQSLLFALSLSQDDELSRLARDMGHTDFAHVWDMTVSLRAEQGDYAPNLSGFNALMHTMNDQAERMGVDEVALVHDAQRQYSPVFTWWQRVLRDAAPGRFEIPTGNTIQLPLGRLQTMRFADSASEIGLQAADIVASAARAVVDSPPDDVESSLPFAGALGDLLSRYDTGQSEFMALGAAEWQEASLTKLLGSEGMRKLEAAVDRHFARTGGTPTGSTK